MTRLGARGREKADPLTLGAWHELTSASRGRLAGLHPRPVLVGSFSGGGVVPEMRCHQVVRPNKGGGRREQGER